MKTLIAACIAFTTVTAHAESLEERQFWKGQRNYIDGEVEKASKACGFTLTFDWVEKPTLRAETEKTNHSPYGVCANIVNQVLMICRQGDDEKAAVKAKIKGFTCGYAKERTLDLKGGIVKYMGNNNQANFSDWARPWLTKRL